MAFALSAAGVTAMWGLTATGGFGGSSGRWSSCSSPGAWRSGSGG